MTLTAADVMKRANITLNDAGLVRWTAPELREYLNDGMREIAMSKPNAVTDTVEISLVSGTRQTLDSAYISIIRVHRNLDSVDADPEGRAGGRAIRAVQRETLDSIMPGWQDPDTLAYSDVVDHVMVDIANPREFFVVPGNDGTGVIEATVSVLPTDVPEPASNPLQIESYTTTLDVPEIYRSPLVNYILYRAYAKDSESANAANRSQAHYAAFQQALGIKAQADMTMNVDQPEG